MSIPIIEIIAADIEKAVNAITVANGYNQILTAVRVNVEDFDDAPAVDGRVLIVQLDEEIPEKQPIQGRDVLQTFALVAFVINSDKAAGSVDTRRNQVKADIIKKLLIDPYRSTYAIDTIIHEAVFFKDNQSYTGVTVPVEIHYRTKHDDPYTKL